MMLPKYFIVLPCFIVTGASTKTVQVLTGINFDAVLREPSNQGLWLLKFYAPWCGHCKRLEPILDDIAPKLSDKMTIGKVDCTVEKDLCKRFNVKGFPTLKFYRDGDYYEYPGERTADSIMAFAEKMNKNSITFIKSYKEALALAENDVDGVAFIAYDKNGKGSGTNGVDLASSDVYTVFQQASRKQQAFASFGILLPSTSTEEINKFDVGPLSSKFIVKVEKDVDTKPFQDESLTVPNLVDFVQSNNIGLITHLSGHNFRVMGQKGKALAIAVIDPSELKIADAFLEKLKYVAKQGIPALTAKYYFCYLDGRKWEKFVNQFNITKTDLPEFFILDVPKKIYWKDESEQNDLHLFLQKVHKGIIPSRKQQGHSGDFILNKILGPIAEFVEYHYLEIIIAFMVIMPLFYYYLFLAEYDRELEAELKLKKEQEEVKKKECNNSTTTTTKEKKEDETKKEK